MGLRPLYIFYSFSVGVDIRCQNRTSIDVINLLINLISAETDFRRQSKVGLRTEKVNATWIDAGCHQVLINWYKSKVNQCPALDVQYPQTTVDYVWRWIRPRTRGDHSTSCDMKWNSLELTRITCGRCPRNWPCLVRVLTGLVAGCTLLAVTL